MALASISQLRKISNFDTSVISNHDLLEWIPIADRIVLKSVSTRVYNENLSGVIDSSNTIFTTKFKPIADVNAGSLTAVDSCDATTDWTSSTDAIAEAVVGAIDEGSGALALGKDGTASTEFSYTKTIGTAVDGSDKELRVTLLIKEDSIPVLDQDLALELRIGSDSSNYYHVKLRRDELKAGINMLKLDIESAASTGSPSKTALDYLGLFLYTVASSDTVTSGDVAMDNWRLNEVDVAETTDVTVYYATYDAQNNVDYGSSQTVSSVDARGGRITMSTAPTSTTAQAGVHGDYSHLPGSIDYDLLNMASTYVLAHLASFKIQGKAVNYSATEDAFLRRDVAGAPDEWLRQAIMLILSALPASAIGLKSTTPGMAELKDNFYFDSIIRKPRGKGANVS